MMHIVSADCRNDFNNFQEFRQKVSKYTMTLANEPSTITRGEKTKYRLAESMKECMCHTPVDAITVRQITENCGLTRQTFYRNFMDKFDLINWYFDKLLIKSFEYMGQGKTVQEGLQLKFSYIAEEKEFFRAAFRYDRQNSLREHDFQLIFRFYQDLIQVKTGSPVSEDIRFLLEMYCHGSISMTIQWVLSGMQSTPEELSRLMVEAMPQKLIDLFASFGVLTEN